MGWWAGDIVAIDMYAIRNYLYLGRGANFYIFNSVCKMQLRSVGFQIYRVYTTGVTVFKIHGVQLRGFECSGIVSVYYSDDS